LLAIAHVEYIPINITTMTFVTDVGLVIVVFAVIGTDTAMFVKPFILGQVGIVIVGLLHTGQDQIVFLVLVAVGIVVDLLVILVKQHIHCIIHQAISVDVFQINLLTRMAIVKLVALMPTLVQQQQVSQLVVMQLLTS